MKKYMLLIACLAVLNTMAQQTIYTANFENNQFDSCWQIVTGKWHIVDVQKMRIAPADGGLQFVLCTGNGYDGDNIINLNVDLPEYAKRKKVKISFYYYIRDNAAGIKIEGEFYEKEIKDGLRGKPWSAYLKLVKGRWLLFEKTLTVPARANTTRLYFYGGKGVNVKDEAVCFDSISILVIK